MTLNPVCYVSEQTIRLYTNLNVIEAEARLSVTG